MDDSLIQKRRAAFPNFLHERMPVLTSFFTDLKAKDPAFVLLQAKNYVDLLDQFMMNQEINAESKNWILTRVGYFTGEYFVQEFSGCWYLNENKQSPNYARYVVGKFAGYNDHISIEPFEIANAYVDSPKPRQLRKLLEEASEELLRLK